jgi:hypothetical protein
MAGKAYSNRKKKSERPESDFYPTPFSLIWALREQTDELDFSRSLRDPCCGKHNIRDALAVKPRFNVSEDDLSIDGYNFLKDNKKYRCIFSNPPFSLFDEFVTHAKEVADKVIFTGRPDAFGAYQRNDAGLWKNLKAVYVFDRKVDYRTPYRTDGLFHVGAMVTCWLVWERGYIAKPTIGVLRVNRYAKLGPIPEEKDAS